MLFVLVGVGWWICAETGSPGVLARAFRSFKTPVFTKTSPLNLAAAAFYCTKNIVFDLLILIFQVKT